MCSDTFSDMDRYVWLNADAHLYEFRGCARCAGSVSSDGIFVDIGVDLAEFEHFRGEYEQFAMVIWE